MSENSIREALEDAFDQDPVGTSDSGVASDPPVATNEPSTAANEPLASTNDPLTAKKDPLAASNTQDKPVRDYVRDEMGKFAPKDEKGTPQEQKPPLTNEKQHPEGVMAGPKTGEPPAPGEKPAKNPIEHAPESWKPEAKALWGQIPDAAKQEIARWELGVKNGLRQAAEVRRFGDAVAQVIEPYRGLIESEGGNAIQAIGSMMKTAQALRTAPPEHKAKLLADVIKTYGVDVHALDRALVGAQPEPVSPEVAKLKAQFEQEIAPLRQMQQQMMQQQQLMNQQERAEARRKVDEFMADPPEFFDNVADDMVQIINLGVQRGVEYSLQQAYDIACRAHPEVGRVLQQREQAMAAQTLTNSAQKARQAAVSVGGAPSIGGQDSNPNSVREAIMLAMNQASR